jgi:NitT/TauT family transport system permease protein
MSINERNYLRKEKRKKVLTIIIQLFIIYQFFYVWQFLVDKHFINSFLFSSPKLMLSTLINLFLANNLFSHIFTTIYETLISFSLGILLGFITAILLYEFKLLARIVDPFLTMLNSLPKVALGPLIIIIFGANTKSVIVMALLINLIISIMTIYNGFLNIDPIRIKLFKTFNVSKIQTLFKLIIPSSYKTIISSLKLNISMSLIGVIMGEFLVSKKGIGYLIINGTQIFNLNLVMLGILLLIIISFILYELISLLEKKLLK